jgi:hypothetical protein
MNEPLNKTTQLKLEKNFKCQALELNESKLVSDVSSFYSKISNAIIKLF